MKDFTLPIYQSVRDWISHSRSKDYEWDVIRLGCKNNEEGLKNFLIIQEENNYWPKLNIEEWNEIVNSQKKAEDDLIDISDSVSIISDPIPSIDNEVYIPKDKFSSWQLYRAKLLKDGFKKESINEIERATEKILKRLSTDTTEIGPIKGLVIGNVQSGKTANMAALMAMAADWGWNMFIILSGTIENLRMQTQSRLFKDLNQPGNIFWRSLEHLSKHVDMAQKAQNLHFNEGSKERYFTVCLKNSTRLRDLIQWAQADKNKQQQMKILVIDDEADQAGINTAHIDFDSDEQERKKINALICNLVNGKTESGKKAIAKYKAMNYIGYTATPYANILNEAGEDSLYPKNFIVSLAVSREYFGPQQIFGYSGDNADYDGLDIVRIITDEQLINLKNIHGGEPFETPESLIDATAWFLCGVACMRIWGYKKPISMLVHTSQKTAHHTNIARVIEKWFEKNSKEKIIERAKKVWIEESNRFTFEYFRTQYPNYDRTDDEINRYPSFGEIQEKIEVILNDGVTNIPLDEEGDLTYHKGIHLCIDNCQNNGVTDGMHVRLAYPDSDNLPNTAPAFIVVGGATLSRGLTLEGLISTFFIRSVGTADTLMQMGRWFGYRKGYELLPRIWLTEKTKEQFEFLAALDQELRDVIQYMYINRISPSQYGPKVKNSPKVKFIRITAKNKMQSAVETDMDYSGASNQTYLFDNDVNNLEFNIKLTEDFIAQLGDEWNSIDKYGCRKNAAVWRGVSFDRIRSYIEKFKFQKRLGVFNDTKPLLDWIEDSTKKNKLGNWNVVIAGKNDDKNGTWELPNGHVINKVNRSRKKPKNELEESVINIGALRFPQDLLADISIDAIQDPNVKQEIINFIEKGSSKAVTAFRDKSGLEITPQLLIYRVDKDSKYNGSGDTRIDLNAPIDLIGLCLYIPGGKVGTNYATTVSIKMKNDVFDGDADLEGTDAD